MAYQKISIVSPVFNESEVIEPFVSRLQSALGKIESYQFKIILVNDGSSDDSVEKIEKLKKMHPIELIHLACNQGQQKAILRGLESARGDAVIVMDSDLQDPPEYIHSLISAWEKGADVVMAQRKTRQDSVLKKLSARAYYFLLHVIDSQMAIDCGDFYLLDKRVVAQIITADIKQPYLRGEVARFAKNRAFVSVDRESRVGGHGNYTLGKMLSLAIAGIRFAMRKDEK